MAVDLSQLPPEIQAAIAAEVARAIAATQPPPPRELSPEEKARLYITQAMAGLSGEKAVSAGSQYIHARTLDVLALLVEKVFAAVPATASTPAASETGSVA